MKDKTLVIWETVEGWPQNLLGGPANLAARLLGRGAL